MRKKEKEGTALRPRSDRRQRRRAATERRRSSAGAERERADGHSGMRVGPVLEVPVRLMSVNENPASPLLANERSGSRIPANEEPAETPEARIVDLVGAEVAGLSTKAIRSEVRALIGTEPLKAVLKRNNAASLRKLTVPQWTELFHEDHRAALQTFLGKHALTPAAPEDDDGPAPTAPDTPEPQLQPQPSEPEPEPPQVQEPEAQSPPSPALAPPMSIEDARKAVLDRLRKTYEESLKLAEGWLINCSGKFQSNRGSWSCMLNDKIQFHSLKDENDRRVKGGTAFFPCVFGPQLKKAFAAGIGLRTFTLGDSSQKVSLLSGLCVDMATARTPANNPCLCYIGRFLESTRAPLPLVDALVDNTAYKSVPRIKIALLPDNTQATKRPADDVATQSCVPPHIKCQKV